MAANFHSLDLQSVFEAAMHQLQAKEEEDVRSAKKMPIVRRNLQAAHHHTHGDPQETALKNAANALSTLWKSNRKR